MDASKRLLMPHVMLDLSFKDKIRYGKNAGEDSG
ncbi:hypothetical protein GKR41_00074 [Candidatus Vallotia lariciata]|nr:hypothetical protein GKR41_00074 [Candidatus Vallotia lariciata]